MDPRQRLALELTWELLEDAFVVPETLRGQPIAVYLGAMNDDYAVLTLAADRVDHHAFAGTSRAIIANRVSFAFGLRGPSVTIDSGQSSSLVAVHLACESVRTGEAPLAVPVVFTSTWHAKQPCWNKNSARYRRPAIPTHSMNVPTATYQATAVASFC